MATEDAAEATEFPPGIGKVARRELALNGYTRYEQLTRVTSAELLAIHGVGPKAVRILDEQLTARGLAFATQEAVATPYAANPKPRSAPPEFS
jgi:predicted flap endonuclease-1-like 5' DNA nuclease